MNEVAENSEDKATKRLITIHSQKGGVGKTLIALYLARKFAQQEEGVLGLRTVLVDADLTGTSLAEAVPLCAPKPDGAEFFNLEATHDELRKISEVQHPSRPWPNPETNRIKFLNDILFSDPIRYNKFMEKDEKKQHPNFRKRHMLWKVDERAGADDDTALELDRLRVIPSSGLPRHVARCVPYIYKETATAFLRRRLVEVVLSLFNEKWDGTDPFDVIVIDTPPVLHGVSRAVLELHDAVATEKNSFQDRGKSFPHLTHSALLMSSADRQHVVATVRALDDLLFHREEAAPGSRKGNPMQEGTPADLRLLLVINRIPENKEVSLPEYVVPAGTSSTVTLKDSALARQHYACVYESLYSPRCAALRRPHEAKENSAFHSLPPFFAEPERTFTVPLSSDLAGIYADDLGMKKYLYSQEIEDLKDLCEVMTHE
ncbi:MAG: P-loop NTPase [Pseudomonadota bacterium]